MSSSRAVRNRIHQWVTQGSLLLALAVSSIAGPARIANAQTPPPPGQIEMIQTDKANRTPQERKLDSQLLFLSRETAGRSAVQGVPSLQSRVTRQADGRVKVDISAAPSAELRQAIIDAGGTIIYESVRWQSVTASVPPAALIGLAARTDVKRIKQLGESIVHSGSVVNQADPAHRADYARTTFGVNGTGITVGVLSDSDAHFTQSISTGDLPADFAALPGQDVVIRPPVKAPQCQRSCMTSPPAPRSCLPPPLGVKPDMPTISSRCTTPVRRSSWTT